MRFFKITVSILLLLILIAVIAAGCLIYFVNPNQLKPVLIQEARKAGYDIAINGRLSWTFYPRVAIEVPQMIAQSLNQNGTYIEVNDLRLGTEFGKLWRNQQDLSGKLYAASLRFGKFRVEKISADAAWENKILKLNDIKANAYNGSLTGKMNGSNLNSTPQWNWDIKLNNIQLQALLMDIAADNKINISGTGYINFQGNTSGKNPVSLTNNLNGLLDFAFKDGVIAGIDLNYVVRTVDSLFNKKDMPPSDGSHGTAYSDLSGNVMIQDGVASSKNLLLLSPAFTTKGIGTLGLEDHHIKIALAVSPQNINSEWQIPVNVSGTLRNPEISLDRDEIARMLAKEQILKVKEKASNWIQNFLNR